MTARPLFLLLALALTACQSNQDDATVNAGQSASPQRREQIERQYFRDTGEFIKCDSRLRCAPSSEFVASVQMLRYAMPEPDPYEEWQLRNQIRRDMGANCWTNRANELICEEEPSNAR